MHMASSIIVGLLLLQSIRWKQCEEVLVMPLLLSTIIDRKRIMVNGDAIILPLPLHPLPLSSRSLRTRPPPAPPAASSLLPRGRKSSVCVASIWREEIQNRNRLLDLAGRNPPPSSLLASPSTPPLTARAGGKFHFGTFWG